MTKRDTYDQLLSVMAGCTADGEPRGAPITVPGGNRAVAQVGLMLTALFRDLTPHMPEEMRQDRVRTALILVFIRWLRLTRITTFPRLQQMVRRVSFRTTH